MFIMLTSGCNKEKRGLYTLFKIENIYLPQTLSCRLHLVRTGFNLLLHRACNHLGGLCCRMMYAAMISG